MAENRNLIKKSTGEVINPATEDKQDSSNALLDIVVTVLGNILTKFSDGLQKTKVVDVNNKNATGEVQATPTANTILGRLKNIWDRLADGNQKIQVVDKNKDSIDGENPFPIRDYPRESDGSNYLSQHLLNGANISMAVDGSSTAVEYSYTVPAGKKVTLKRGFVVIEDGVVAFDSNDFGALSVLSNGVEVSITPNGESKQVLENWKTNREMRDSMFDFDQEWKADGAYVGRWTFTKDINESGFVLNAGDKFSFLVQDNLAGLDYLSFRLKGRYEY